MSKTLAVARLEGPIMQNKLCLANVRTGLDKAFKIGKEVAIIVNSPGGMPCQSSLIHDYIVHLSRKHDKLCSVFVEDAAASGGYWIAAAGSNIFVNQNSIVGSIGVISGGFGYVDLLNKIGVERRVFTAGENKIRLDPFQPLKNDDVSWLQDLQAKLHENFKRHVCNARGLSPERDADVFDGNVWIGSDAVCKGLADDVMSVEAYADLKDLKVKHIKHKTKFSLKGLFGLSAEDVATELASRDMWSRLGL